MIKLRYVAVILAKPVGAGGGGVSSPGLACVVFFVWRNKAVLQDNNMFF